MQDFRSITIIRPVDREKAGQKLIIKNPTEFPLIGNGAQGAVFKLSANRCVKIYGKKIHAEQEKKSLQAAQGLPFAPKVYEAGENYIVMEFVKGTPLDAYLKKKKKLPLFVTKGILSLFKQFKRAGYVRMDARLRHLVLTKKKTVRAFDHVNAFVTKISHPENLYQDLKKIRMQKTFLKQVKQLDSRIYREWKKQLDGS